MNITAENSSGVSAFLSYVCNAHRSRHVNSKISTPQNYIFSLLTGYCDPPAGIECGEGQNFNPYFAGSMIGMAAPLYDEIIEYEDGTYRAVSSG
jgi:ubiquinol-cytochrome c reductase cytochrome c1 subunit